MVRTQELTEDGDVDILETYFTTRLHLSALFVFLPTAPAYYGGCIYTVYVRHHVFITMSA